MIDGKRKNAGKGSIAYAGIMILMSGFLIARGNAATVIQKEEALAGDVSIDVMAKAQVAEEMVLLKDIAVIHADEEMKNRIENIRISLSPRPGNISAIPGGRITSVLRNNRWIPANTQIAVPESVLIEREYQLIPDDLLESFFKDYIDETVGDSNYELSQFKVRGTVKYPSGSLSLEALDKMKDRHDNKGMTGRVNLNVAVKINGAEEGRISLSGWLQRIGKIVVVKRPVPRDMVLTEADVALEERKTSTETAQFFLSVDDVLGKRAKRNIPPGTFLKQNMLAIPPMIQKGDQVKIVAKNGSLMVTTSGIAEENGAVGEQIEVRNINSDKPVTGVVKDKSIVEVLF